jgi:hypothetical protein
MSNFWSIENLIREALRDNGEVVDVGEWQSIRAPIPQSRTIEIEDVHFNLPISADVEGLQRDIEPNLPWAEDHFLERVSGVPANPGVQYKNWPWYRGNVEQHQTQELQKFSHTYMERYWPKHANQHFPDRDRRNEIDYSKSSHRGIRYNYGDLNDVVSLLARSPYTRQAYLPVWFPEDTGAVPGERVPCSLGYHFLLRNGRLNVYYFIRSCDFFRHFRDDVYLTCRLGQWVLDKVKYRGLDDPPGWEDVEMGDLIMQIDSLHVFEDERKRLWAEL